MQKYFETLNRLNRIRHKEEMWIILRTNPLFKALPDSTDVNVKTNKELAIELSMDSAKVSEGLQLLKQNGLAKLDKVKHGWRKAN
ncbi:MAG: hypothetical protein JXA46_09120 [Dehalococcoidales bacterium]|nr:hypothetical protein [Dehalococcoidales bacterium]